MKWGPLLLELVFLLRLSAVLAKDPLPLVTLCRNLQNLHNTRRIQGLFLVSEDNLYLYLVADNNVFKLPYKNDFIDSENGQLALFERMSTQVQHLGRWDQLSWLRADQVNLDGRSRLKLIVVHTPPNTDEAFVVIFTKADGTSKVKRFWFRNSTGSNLTMAEGEEQNMLYGLLKSDELVFPDQVPADALRALKLDKKLSKWVPDFVIRRYKNGNIVAQWAKSLKDDGGKFKFSENSYTWYTNFDLENRVLWLQNILASPEPPPYYNPLVPMMPSFGFIFQSKVHLWDVFNRRVLLFQHPIKTLDWDYIKSLYNSMHGNISLIGSSSKLFTLFNRPIEVSVIPFDEYFACSEQDWKDKSPWISWISWIVIPTIICSITICCVWSNCVDDKSKSQRPQKRDRKNDDDRGKTADNSRSSVPLSKSGKLNGTSDGGSAAGSRSGSK